MTNPAKIAAVVLWLYLLPGGLVVAAVLSPWWHLAPAAIPAAGVAVGVALVVLAVVRQADPGYATRLVRYTGVVLLVAAVAVFAFRAIQPGYMGGSFTD